MENAKPDQQETSTLLEPCKPECEPQGGCRVKAAATGIDAWDISHNLRTLVSVERTETAALHGIRAIALLWVAWCHVFDFLWRDLKMVELARPVIVIQNGAFGVDMFFTLSGFLIAEGLLKRPVTKSYYPSFVLRRFLRLWPVLALVVLYSATGATPADPDSPDDPTQSCRLYWWTNLLFLNDLFGPETLLQNSTTKLDMCVGQSWSTAVEFQFYLVTPLIIYVLQYGAGHINALPADDLTGGSDVLIDSKVPSLLFDQPILVRETAPDMRARLEFGSIWKLLFLVALSIIPIIIKACILINKYFIQLDVGVDVGAWYYPEVYQVPYCRATPYVIGVGISYLLAIRAPLVGNQDATTAASEPFETAAWRWLGHVLITCLWIALAWFGGGTYDNWFPEFNFWSAENLIKIFIGQPAVGICVGWFIYFAMIHRARGLSWFLSAKFWTPLSRMSYTMYMLQFIVLGMMEEARVRDFHLFFDPFCTTLQCYAWASLYSTLVCVVVFIFSIPVYLFVEKPIINMSVQLRSR